MKRILSIILAVLMIISLLAVAGGVSAQQMDAGFTATSDEATFDEATKDEAGLESLPEKPEGTNRYFFRVPDYWYDSNPYTENVGIYWWEGSDACREFPGHEAKPADAEGVYYYDVPVDVTSVIWNNFVGADPNNYDNIRFMYMTGILATEYYESWESTLYPYGTDSFDGMIYVIDLDKTEITEFNGKSDFYGEWFYYYGNGEYGVSEYKENADIVLTGDTVNISELSPDEDNTKPIRPTQPEDIVTETYRYYFYMPEMWKENNPYTETVGIYWWEGTDACIHWPGYEAKPADVEGVYYYDVPVDVPRIIWSNFVDGGSDMREEIYVYAYQTVNVGTEYYDYYESELYPEGTDNFDEMIYVIDLDKTDVNEYSGKHTFKGEWFYYYGNGEYGLAESKEDAEFVLSGDNVDLSKLMGEEETTIPEDSVPSTTPEDFTYPSEKPTTPQVQDPDKTDRPENTYRYYFYMPKSWAEDHPYSVSAGIYWWEGSEVCSSWPGYQAKYTGIEGIYYYDVPTDVTCIVWNNAIDGGTDVSAPIFDLALQTKTIGTEYYDMGESKLYPEGTDNFDNMIYVIDYNLIDYNEFSGKRNYKGEWFYYYGNGEYGVAENKAEAVVVYNTDTIDVAKVYKENFTDGELNTRPTEPATDPTEVIPDATEETLATEPTEVVTTPSTEAEEPSESATVTEPAESVTTTEATANVIEPTEATTESLPVLTKPTEPSATTEAEEPSETTKPTETTEATEPSSTVPEVEFELGDANKDGKLNIRDATIIQKHLAKMVALDEKAVALADFDLNGKVNIKDATMIQKKIAGLI